MNQMGNLREEVGQDDYQACAPNWYMNKSILLSKMGALKIKRVGYYYCQGQ